MSTATLPTPTASTPTSHHRTNRTSNFAKFTAIFTIVAGAAMILAGVATWVTVQNSLSNEHITVSDDSPRFAGDVVNGPITAYQETQMIQKHYLEATGGKTYAELGRDDPLRETAMTASFLRASLFTSVVAFGVAAMATGLGIVLLVLGLAFTTAAREQHQTA
jgi:uncharacterized membrane protein